MNVNSWISSFTYVTFFFFIPTCSEGMIISDRDGFVSQYLEALKLLPNLQTLHNVNFTAIKFCYDKFLKLLLSLITLGKRELFFLLSFTCNYVEFLLPLGAWERLCYFIVVLPGPSI